MNNADAAALVGLGLSIKPLKTDGSKAPKFKGTEYQDRLATAQEIAAWGNELALGINCGQVSGNLEVIDIDDLTWFPDYLEQVHAFGGEDIWGKIAIVKTPRPGYHIYYRCNEIDIPGNQKLAYAAPEKEGERPKTKIETRGQGGYVVAPGSSLSVHETGNPYEWAQGSYEQIPLISAKEREILIQAGRSLNQYADIEWSGVKTEAAKPPKTDGVRPGDDYNQRTSWDDLLKGHGWQVVKRHAGVTYWRQPEKQNKGHSATTGYAGIDILYIFSSNCYPFTPGFGYQKFTAYTMLDHGGDFNAAGKALAKQGFGKKSLSIAPSATEAYVPLPEQEISGRLQFTDAHFGDILAKDLQGRAKYTLHGWKIWDQSTGLWAADERDCRIRQMARETLDRFTASIPPALEDEQIKAYEKAARRMASETSFGKMIKMCSAKPGIYEDYTKFDNEDYDHLLNCQNGLLDLNTGEMLEFNSKYLITKKSNFIYDPNATCPLFDRCLQMWFPGQPGVVQFFWQWFGYNLTGYHNLERFVFFEGRGANGKSIIREIVYFALGGSKPSTSYACSLPAHTVMLTTNINKTVDISRSIGCRMAKIGEVKRDDKLDVATVKDLTSQEAIAGKKLYIDGFDFRPTAKLWMHGNYRMEINETTDGLWRRFIPIKFPRQIPEADRDPMLYEKLKVELSGMLNKAMKAWQYLVKQKNFELPSEIQKNKISYRTQMDPYKAWTDQGLFITGAPQDHESTTDLYYDFKAWCYSNEIDCNINQTAFIQRLKEDFTPKRTSSSRGFQGLKLKTIQNRREIQHHAQESFDSAAPSNVRPS